MSGSGGGSWVSPTDNSCDRLAQHTTLNSPNREVLKTIKKGDILDIGIRQAGKAIIVEATKDGNVAGTITSSIIQRLAECIEEGHVYVAEVTENVNHYFVYGDVKVALQALQRGSKEALLRVVPTGLPMSDVSPNREIVRTLELIKLSEIPQYHLCRISIRRTMTKVFSY